MSLFDVIHTIDREKIAKVISLEMKKQNKQIPCFIQVNTGYEIQKSGIEPKFAADLLNCVSMITLFQLLGLCVSRQQMKMLALILHI